MKETVKLGFILFAFTAVAAGILAVTNSFTAPIIVGIEKEASFDAFSDLFPEGEDFEELDSSDIEVISQKYPEIIEGHKVLEGSEVTGYAFKTESSGYGDDPIVTIIGINDDGTLAGIDVVSHSETPGFGADIDEDSFKDTFKGKTTDSTLVPVESPSEENEVMLITGSTITSEGILRGINAAREAYLDNFNN